VVSLCAELDQGVRAHLDERTLEAWVTESA
jgi:hypothetical protein